MNVLVSGNEMGCSLGLHGLGKDAIAVVVVHDHNVVITHAGWSNEATSLVREYFASSFEDGGIAEMGRLATIIGHVNGEGVVVKIRLVGSLGGSLIFAYLVQMAHGGGM